MVALIARDHATPTPAGMIARCASVEPSGRSFRSRSTRMTGWPTRCGCPREIAPHAGVVILHGAGSCKESHHDFRPDPPRRRTSRRWRSTPGAMAPVEGALDGRAIDDVAQGRRPAPRAMRQRRSAARAARVEHGRIPGAGGGGAGPRRRGRGHLPGRRVDAPRRPRHWPLRFPRRPPGARRAARRPRPPNRGRRARDPGAAAPRRGRRVGPGRALPRARRRADASRAAA